MQSAQLKIKETVKDYKNIYPTHYAAVIKVCKQMREDNITEFAEMPKGTSDTDLRPLHKIPTDLYGMFKMILDDDEFKWFRSKTGARWFASTFREFSIPKKI